MNEYFKIAWRNLWRNKRRTIITISSIFFASLIAILMRSFQLGSYNHLLNNMITQFTGHLQIQQIDFFDNPSIDNSIVYSQKIKNILDSLDEVVFYTPRIETGVLASSGANSKMAFIMGADFLKEKKLSKIDKRVVRYLIDSNVVNEISAELPLKLRKKIKHYKQRPYTKVDDIALDLIADGIDTSKFFQKIIEKSKLPDINIDNFHSGILIGTKLAQYLELNVGDSLIIMGQGFHGASAIGKYRIAGFVKFPTDAFNSRIVYMPLKELQNFLSAYEIDSTGDTVRYVNYISVNTIYPASVQNKDYRRLMTFKNKLQKIINNPEIVVIGWKNLNKDIIQGIELDNNSGKIIIGVLYLIIAFGILGTVMMMIAERKREFGVMISIGMKRAKLSLILALEMFYMAIIAVFTAILISAPIIWIGYTYPLTLHGDIQESLSMYNMEPVMPMAWFDTYILAQVLVVLGIVALILIYALFRVNKIKVVDALRS